jgi:ubiquinone/menaquinone biosynthesis C-methylase UbiE
MLVVMGADGRYVFASTAHERERLSSQSGLMRPATERLFRAAGIGPGARVLDCGCGGGDVSILLAELVTSAGEVVGIDRDPDQVGAASRRAKSLGLSNVRFVTADISAPPPGPFDAVVGRLVLMYLSDPESVLRVLASRVVTGGVMAFMEYDFMPSAEYGMWPRSELIDQIHQWNLAAFHAFGVQERMGARLPSLFTSVGLNPQLPHEVSGFVYDGEAAIDQIVAVMRGSAATLTELGIAKPEEIDIDALPQRLSIACGPAPVLVIAPHIGVWATKS